MNNNKFLVSGYRFMSGHWDIYLICLKILLLINFYRIFVKL